MKMFHFLFHPIMKFALLENPKPLPLLQTFFMDDPLLRTNQLSRYFLPNSVQMTLSGYVKKHLL